jgi:hypothetical protein
MGCGFCVVGGYKIVRVEDYSIAWFENIVLNLLEEFVGQPAPEGRYSPFGGVVLCETGNE